MADYLDAEAEESEEEEELNVNERKKLKRLKAMQDSDDEEDDDEEGEVDGLIDDSPIEENDGEDSDASDDSRKRKKSDDEEFDDRLEDEDYDLLEENLGVKVERKHRFKRLRRIQDEESEGEKEGEGDDERDAIANELFQGGSGDDDEERSEISHSQRPDVDAFDEEESEDEDDFIVDGDGVPITEKKKKRRPIFSDAALQEAQDIFGIDFDYDEFGKYGEDGFEEEEEEEEEDEYIQEEGDRPRRSKKHLKKKSTKKSIFEIYEPSELIRGHFTDVDNEIRTTDIPERMQLRTIPLTPTAEGSDELELEADWIYKQAFCQPTISVQDAHLNEEAKERAKKGPQTIPKIKKAIDFMRNQNFEVPFISFYRKEYVLPELNINDLWKIYKYDGKWCQLKQRKENLLKLFDKMRNYQLDEIMKSPDAPLPDNIRIIKDDDIERLKSAQTSEEFNDIYRHFMLYYSQDLPAMQEDLSRKEKEARRKSRIEKRRQEIAQAEENGEDPPEELPDIEEIEEEAEDTLKQPVRKGPYAICRKAGLDGLAKKFGLPPEHFAENLRDNYQRHEVDQEPVEPAIVAEEFCSAVFKTTDEVLKGVELMVAIQLAHEPLVRKCVREMYMERAKISVKPTKKGIKEIDENHPLYTLKYIKDKPVPDLVGDQFLKLMMGHEDKLVTVSFSDVIDGNTSSNYVDEVKQLYYRDEFSKSVQDWNTLRTGSVEMALNRIIIPQLKKELLSNLLTEAKDCVMKACCRKMYNWIKIAPYSYQFPEEEDDDWDTSKGIRAMGVAYVPDQSQSAFTCLIAPDGECTDYLRLPHLMKRKNAYRESDKVLKEADLLAIRNFIATKKPHVVVVGGESRDALMVVEDIKECITTLMEEEQFPQIQVEICDNELSKVYANSNRGVAEFRDYPDLLREAISLARRLQDPLLEFSQLCTIDEEILCLKYHPLQDQLPKEELIENLYLEFINCVNEVGVDLNRAVQEPYTSNLVQFVCGLGARKAQSLMKILKQTNQRLENRTQLITACHMGPKVFVNCAGFIKIDTNSLGDSTEAYVEVLDGSRVHPETYEWARKMAVDALEYDDEDANPAGALEEILESPERLKDLDLDAFAEELERQGFGNKCITLYDIRAELNSRYKDLRVPYQSPNTEKLFDILTKETPETFFVGKLVMARVIGITHRKPQGEQLDQANPVRNDETGLWQCPFCLKNDFPELSEVWNHFDAGACPGKATGVRLKLDNDISGYIHIKNLSDKHVGNPEERVHVGQVIHCRIIKIEVERFSVECTSKTSDLLDKNREWRPQKDVYYDVDAEEKDKKTEEDAKKVQQRQTYVKRVIIHPSFHNVSFAEAERLMQAMKQGEAIIRPSSKGSDHLTVTWKVTERIYQHIDVREEGKENAFSLGRSLWIGNEEFEDLDEIIARHVNPMAAYTSELLDFKYFKPTLEGIKDKAEEIIKEQKKQNPGGIPYIISAAKSYPGKFLLSYLPRTRCRHEYVSVSPDGYKFRGHMFSRVSDLFRWFKEHFRDPIPGQVTPGTPHAMASRTPYSSTPAISGVNPDAVQRVAQNMPHHMLHNLSKVASQTPHYPPHTPGAASVNNYGMFTPYTPSGQTPFMTPYHTPHHTPHYPQTPSNAKGPFLPPVPPAINSNSHRPAKSQRPSSDSFEETNWSQAAEAWARAKQTTSKESNITPRYDDSRRTPRNQEFQNDRATPRNNRTPSGRTPSYKSPRGTPFTNSSPQSMSLSGDGTPLYDENW